MTNPYARGSAPGRARPANQRPGSFKPGHKKRGGRKRGTPNLFSTDYRMAILEAAHRIGQDGDGKNGVVGYLSWVGERHPRIFYTVLYVSLLPLQAAASNTPEEPQRTITAESNMPEESCRTVEDMVKRLRDYLRRKEKNPTKSESPPDWTGQDFPVGDLMKLAVEKPRAFCTLLVAGFLRPPTKRRRPAPPRGSWPQAAAA